MTNYERLMKQMTEEKLAELLVTEMYVDYGDYAFDGVDEYYVENYQMVFESCASPYEYSDYTDCKNDTVEWLKKESEV